jgi:hypothetical protein
MNRPHSRMIRDEPTAMERMFPKLLIAMSALSAVPALPSPKTAVKNRLAVNSFEVRILSFGTEAEKSEVSSYKREGWSY